MIICSAIYANNRSGSDSIILLILVLQNKNGDFSISVPYLDTMRRESVIGLFCDVTIPGFLTIRKRHIASVCVDFWRAHVQFLTYFINSSSETR